MKTYKVTITETLEKTVRTIFKVIKHMEHEVWYKYPQAVKKLPDDIFFITTEELYAMYPDKTPKERENLITKEHGCVFLMKIGDKLPDGKPHDGRAPDYDDWQLNGDILFWYETLNCALEISSMGIRVSEESLKEQLVKAGCPERENLPWHKALLAGEFPYGGERYAGRVRIAGAGREDDSLRLEGGDAREVDLVVADHLHVRPKPSDLLHEVVGERVVVVNHQYHSG